MSAFSGVDKVHMLGKAMQVAEMNHRVISNNIANVDTPHFNPQEIDFQDTLRREIHGQGRFELRRSLHRHMDLTREAPRFSRLAMSSKNDYNKVDLDHEITKLAENRGKYNLYGSFLVKHFQQVKRMLSDIR